MTRKDLFERAIEMDEFVVEYYLPNQSRLFSGPQRYSAKGLNRLREVLEIAENNSYEIVCVSKVAGEGFMVPGPCTAEEIDEAIAMERRYVAEGIYDRWLEEDDEEE